MPTFNVLVPHELPQDEAMKRVKKALADLKTQFADKIKDLCEDWNGNACEFHLSAMGFSGSGTMIVKPLAVEISGNLPFLAFPFKSKIESTIRERLKQILN
ncbi:MAG: polyhydroxyalkanoic acid system family protein [Sedimentisphaerales bacterium]|jgi:hypothetical protein